MKAGMIFLLSTLFLCSCYAAAPKTYGEHLMRIEEIVPRKALESENKWIVKYGDFSGDGKEEMVAFVYEVTGGDGEMEWGQYYITARRMVLPYVTLLMAISTCLRR